MFYIAFTSSVESTNGRPSYNNALILNSLLDNGQAGYENVNEFIV